MSRRPASSPGHAPPCRSRRSGRPGVATTRSRRRLWLSLLAATAATAALTLVAGQQAGIADASNGSPAAELPPPPDWTSVTATAEYTCGIEIDHHSGNKTLWCWGDNGAGQLGIGGTTGVRTPTQVGHATNWQSVSANLDHTCAIQSGGTLSCFGDNEDGQLGDGSTQSRDTPVQVDNADWTDVSTGFAHTCGIQSDGTLWCWGFDGYGQLGDGGHTNQSAPVQVGTATTWTSVAAGGNHTCALAQTGSVWCWGDNSHGETAQGHRSQVRTPARVGSNQDWTDLTAGGEHTCGIRAGATLWCWGDDGVHAVHRTPWQVAGGTSWTAVTAGVANTCALQSDTLWCWGVDDHGQLGQGNTKPKSPPTEVNPNDSWTSVAVGGEHTCAVKSDQTLWCWGQNTFGELGDSDGSDRFLPTPVLAPTRWSAVSSSGWWHACGVQFKTDTLYCWGLNDRGQLGNGTTTNATLPVKVNAYLWSSVSGGYANTCGILVNLTLWCWGDNDKGQLGLGNTTQYSKPKQVGSIATWQQVSTGYDHTCGTALDDNGDGTAWCWGDNADGELGDGSTTDAHSPQQVPSAAPWLSVSAGTTHSCGIQVGGSLWCWGDNGDGELGDGTKTSESSPVQVGNPAWTWSSVTAGGGFTCALRADAPGLYCWGVNSHGQAGQAPSGDITTPTEVTGGGTWTDVQAGDDHTCGVQQGVSLWCWGQSRDGDLGSTGGDTGTPIQVAPNIQWQATGTYADSTCALSHVTLKCFGRDALGQLGDGSPVQSRVRPVVVLVVAP